MSTKNTMQKQVVLNVVTNMRFHPSAEEVYEKVSENFPTISLATVYRNLNALSDEGKIQKIYIANHPDRFDFNLSKHTHCVCSVCSRVFDFPFSPEFPPEAFENEEFRAKDFYFVINGVCKKCSSEI
jgi:Fe2+ or Zn2+ uptake regulation protein